MSYKVLYRKYRPKTFEEVKGQDHIVRTLTNALKENKISHAYLFCGPRGTGKTSTAKLFAKAINCEDKNKLICNKCENCIEANNNSHPDIIEIDAASNNGVNEVRNLIDKVKFAPIKGKYKVYIIDEVHMMTSGAFNALLKTLEEPPAHIVFILATTEPHKVLPTILSRCQRYDFNKIEENKIKEYLIEILNKENIKFEDTALDPIISLADGGLRDALMMLDQVLSYKTNDIKLSDVLDLFGIASLKEKLELIKYISEGNLTKAFEKSNYFVESGIDIKKLITSLLEIYKDILINEYSHNEKIMHVLKYKDAKEFEDKYSVVELNKIIQILIETESQFKIVSSPRALLEITILKLLTIKNNNIKKEESKKVEIKKTEIKKENTIETVDKVETSGDINKIDDNTIIKLMLLGNKEERVNLSNNWKNNLTSLPSNQNISQYIALLIDGTPYLITDSVLILSYDFTRIANKVNIKSNQKELSNIVSKIINKKLIIYAIDKDKENQLKDLFKELRINNKLPNKEAFILKEEDL